MVFSVSEQDRLDEQIWIDPNIPLHSVAKLLKGPDFNSKSEARRQSHKAIPAPKELTARSRELKKLRATSVWIDGNRDEQVDQMEFWFTDIPTNTSPSHKKAKTQAPTTFRSRGKTHKQPADSPYQTTPCPSSDIGTLIKLPGEIRNRIYRLVLLTPDPIVVEMPFRTCGIGRCLHTKVGYNAPGIAQTCKQLRWEALPIYLAEHPGVQFDAGATRDGCGMRFLESVGQYADLIPKYTFVLERPIWKLDTFEEYAVYHFSITTPKWDGSGGYSLEQWESAGRKICQCALEKLVAGLNEQQKKGKLTGKAMLELMDDEDFSDFVWRVKKTKQWPQHLAKCSKCKQIIFNN